MKSWNLPEGSVGASIAEGRSYYCYVEWTLIYKEAAGRFYKQILPALVEIGPPESTRLVFGFDS